MEMDAGDKLRVLHDFYRTGKKSGYHFDMEDTMRKGHSFKDFICPDSFEFEKNHFKMGNQFGRVLFLREYASYIKDVLNAELTDFNRNLMMSIDVIPIPTDEAVREVETRLLGVETSITNWQRRQNANNNFSAVVPYDMEQHAKRAKNFWMLCCSKTYCRHNRTYNSMHNIKKGRHKFQSIRYNTLC